MIFLILFFRDILAHKVLKLTTKLFIFSLARYISWGPNRFWYCFYRLLCPVIFRKIIFLQIFSHYYIHTVIDSRCVSPQTRDGVTIKYIKRSGWTNNIFRAQNHSWVKSFWQWVLKVCITSYNFRDSSFSSLAKY